MGKLIQFKSNQGENLYPTVKTGIIKQVRNLDMGYSSSALVDNDIKKANQIVIYYSLNANNYRRSMTIPRPDVEWFEDYAATGASIFFRMDWSNGSIVISQYSSQDNWVRILGYDLIR